MIVLRSSSKQMSWFSGSPGNARGPNTVKGAQSDPNYVTRLGLGPVANVCRGPENYSYAIALQPLLWSLTVWLHISLTSPIYLLPAFLKSTYVGPVVKHCKFSSCIRNCVDRWRGFAVLRILYNLDSLYLYNILGVQPTSCCSNGSDGSHRGRRTVCRSDRFISCCTAHGHDQHTHGPRHFTCSNRPHRFYACDAS